MQQCPFLASDPLGFFWVGRWAPRVKSSNRSLKPWRQGISEVAPSSAGILWYRGLWPLPNAQNFAKRTNLSVENFNFLFRNPLEICRYQTLMTCPKWCLRVRSGDSSCRASTRGWENSSLDRGRWATSTPLVLGATYVQLTNWKQLKTTSLLSFSSHQFGSKFAGISWASAILREVRTHAALRIVLQRTLHEWPVCTQKS